MVIPKTAKEKYHDNHWTADMKTVKVRHAEEKKSKKPQGKR